LSRQQVEKYNALQYVEEFCRILNVSRLSVSVDDLHVYMYIVGVIALYFGMFTE
jgi:hypothetical protein